MKQINPLNKTQIVAFSYEKHLILRKIKNSIKHEKENKANKHGNLIKFIRMQ